MYTILICVAFSIVVVYASTRNKRFQHPVSDYAFWYVFSAIVAGVLGMFGAEIAGVYCPTVVTTEDVGEIVPIADGSYLSGSFVLSLDRFDGHYVYQVFVKEADGGKTHRTFDSRNVRIYEQEGLKGTGRWRRLRRVYDRNWKWKNFVFIPDALMGLTEELTVPAGTVRGVLKVE
jgi:hypothetical protein